MVCSCTFRLLARVASSLCTDSYLALVVCDSSFCFASLARILGVRFGYFCVVEGRQRARSRFTRAWRAVQARPSGARCRRNCGRKESKNEGKGRGRPTDQHAASLFTASARQRQLARRWRLPAPSAPRVPHEPRGRRTWPSRHSPNRRCASPCAALIAAPRPSGS